MISNNKNPYMFLVIFVLLVIVISGCSNHEITTKNQKNIDEQSIDTTTKNSDLDRNPFSCNGKISYSGSLVLVVIDQQTYSALEPKIKRFQEDIKHDLCSDVEIKIIMKADDPESIRSYLLTELNENNLIGVIFIGDIPFKQLGISSDEKWPSMEYYSELDTNFIDKGEYIIRDREHVVQSRTIWKGILLPPNFYTDRTNAISLLSSYFDRNHLYRMGEMSYNKKLLYYNVIDESSNDKSLEITPDYKRYSSNDIIMPADSKDYLRLLQEPNELTFIFAHGSPTFQEINSQELQTANPKGLFYAISGCEVGKFDVSNYLGGYYLFLGNGLAVYAPQSKVFAQEGQNRMVFLRNLQAGKMFGQVFSTILGDPTLRLFIDNVSDIRISCPKEIDMGILKPSLNFEKRANVTITNEGKDTLIIYSGDPLPSGVGSWSVNYPVYVGSGESFVYPFIMMGPNLPVLAGQYTDNFYFETNHPYETSIKIGLKYTIDTTGISFECLYPSNFSALCDRENLHTFYSGDCNKITGQKLCEQSGDKRFGKRKCVTTHYYTAEGSEPYITYTLTNDKETDCNSVYDRGRMFYVIATCCSIMPVS